MNASDKSHKFRLVTRSDFDGLACAVLLKERGLIDDIVFVHPKDVQDGKIAITSRDILTNLPYAAEAHIVFDHHASEVVRLGRSERANHVIDANAPSAARVVYEHFGGREAFPAVSPEMMEAVDKGDSGAFNMEEVLNPGGWVLLNFLMDARTGSESAQDDLDEAWEIAERGPMRLFMADIHLYRARLFHNVKPYPWNKNSNGSERGPKDDLAAARKLIEKCGYWRRKEELEDAEEAAKNW